MMNTENGRSVKVTRDIPKLINDKCFTLGKACKSNAYKK